MQQLIREGIVSTVNTVRGTVRVTFPDGDNMVSAELPVLSIGGLFLMPKIGTPALCLFTGDDLGKGFYLGTYFQAGVPDTTQGAVVTGNLNVTGNQTVSGDVTISGTLHGGGIT